MQSRFWTMPFWTGMAVLYGAWAISCMTGYNWFAFIAAPVSAYYVVMKNTRKDLLAISVVATVAFQNLVIGIFGQIGDQVRSLLYMTQIPILYIGSIYVLLLVTQKLRIEKVTIAYFALMLVAVVAAVKSGLWSLQDFRNLSAFYFAFEIGRYCLDNKENFLLFARRFIALSWIMAIAGFVMLEIGYPLYSMMGIEQVYIAKGLANEAVSHLPGRFNSDIFGHPVTRLGSLYYEPVSVTYFFAASVIAALSVKWTSNAILRWGTLVVFIWAAVQSGGKGGLLILAVLLASMLAFRILKFIFTGFTRKVLFWITVGASTVAVWIFAQFYSANYAGPAKAHFDSITGTFDAIMENPLGYGLGMGGMRDTTGHGWLASGGESALMSFGFQLGIPGLIVLLSVFALMAATLLNRVNQQGFRWYIYCSTFIPVAVYGVSVFQGNTVTPQACVPLMVFAAGLIGTNTTKETTHENSISGF